MTLGRCPLSIFCSRGTPPRGPQSGVLPRTYTGHAAVAHHLLSDLAPVLPPHSWLSAIRSCLFTIHVHPFAIHFHLFANYSYRFAIHPRVFAMNSNKFAIHSYRQVTSCCSGARIFIELVTSDRKLKAPREGSKRGTFFL